MLVIVFYAVYHTPAYEYEHVCAHLATNLLLESVLTIIITVKGIPKREDEEKSTATRRKG